MLDLGPEPGSIVGLAEAFPWRLRADVRAALQVLPSAEHRVTQPFRVLLSGEVVSIPYQRLERVIGVVEPWVAPFVVRLIGEYVDEIVLAIQRLLLSRLNTGSVADSVCGRQLPGAVS